MSTCLVVVNYRNGPLTANFVVELSDILDHLSMSGVPLLLTGDANIHLERALDTTAIEFIELLECYGPILHVTGPTHDAGGTINVVCTRCDLPPPTVDIIDVGIYDHGLLRGASRRQRQPPVYTPSTHSGGHSMLLRFGQACLRRFCVTSDMETLMVMPWLTCTT